MRIRTRLLLLVSAVLWPALIAAGIAVAWIYREHQAFNRATLEGTAAALAAALDVEINRRKAVLNTLARASSLRLGDMPRFYENARAVAAQDDDAIILSDLEGRQLLNTRLPLGAKLPPMLPMERDFRKRSGNEPTLISDVYQPPAGLGPHSFAVQVPIRRDGQVVQFLTLASYASQLQKLVADPRLPQGWHATIFDRQQVVAARSVEPEKFVGQTPRGELRTLMASQEAGSYDGQRNLSGGATTAFFSRAPESGWTFLIAVPTAAVTGAAGRTTAILTAISLMLLACGLAAAWAVARRVSEPVEALRGSAQRLGSNEPVQPPRSGTLELDAVGEAMERASERQRGATAELEERVAQAVHRYEQSQRALVQAQKLEALGRLTGGIAHDFNNVLQTLHTGLEVLKLRVRGEDELIARCQRAVQRGSGLARQLMAFGRVQDLRVETLDPGQSLAQAGELLRGGLPSNIELRYEMAAGLWPVTVDPAQLELAVLNLVINARDAMPQGGTVILRAGNETLAAASGDLAAGEYVAIALTDTGTGMAEEVMARAFEPFYTTKEPGKGTGMGLPQAYGFARQSAGTLKLHSRPGYGTTVTLYLPRAGAAVIEAGTAHPVPAIGRGSVLVVEDDELVRDTVSEGLSAAGFEVLVAATAEEALQRIGLGGRYDAVFTDVMLPGRMSGIELAKELRAKHPRTAVVVATGYSDQPVLMPGVRALAKPYELKQVVEALNAALAGVKA